MFEKIKEYWLYVVLWLIALWLLWWSYLLTHNNKKWYEIEDKVITTTLQAISRWKNEKIQKNTTIWWQVLWEIWDENIWDKKIHKEKMLLLTSQNYDSIIDEWKITDDITRELFDWLEEWEVKYIQILWTATEIEWQPDIKSVQLTKDNKVIIWNQTFEWKDLQKVDANLKWYDWSWYWFWPYSKDEVRSAIDNYFTNWTPVQIWDTDEYIVALDHKFNDSIKWKLVSKLWSNTWWTPPPVVNDKAIIPWTKDWYTITTHVWEQLEKNVKETENVLLEKTITNWKQKFSWTIKITWNNTTVLENINSLWTNCNSWYKEESWNCVQECLNPIYLDSNWITVKAKNCAKDWESYQWNWETWYVARDLRDVRRKINSWEFRANKIVTSKLRRMDSMLSWASSFNQDVSNWDVSNVTRMENMFQWASSFNQDISNWNVSNVINMSSLFLWATSFNQPLNNWNTINVKNMSWMFQNATSFNQDISNFNVSKVTDMTLMFNWASSFNQPLNNWNVSNVQTMWSMFSWAISFNQDISNWNVSNVKIMKEMFSWATSFNQPLNNWNTSNVQTMFGMFTWAVSFNQPLNNWNVSNVTDMRSMFNWATSFNQPLNNWNVSNVTNMYSMFNWATSFNQDISNWNVWKVSSWALFANNSPIQWTNKVPAKFR